MDRLPRRLVKVATSSSSLLWQDAERRFERVWTAGADGLVSESIAVTIASEQAQAASIERLAHEHALREHLDNDWALKPQDLIRDRGRTVLILPPCAGTPLLDRMNERQPSQQWLRIAIALATSLARLHERSLVHQDIRPANLLLSADGKRAWLTGFGLATLLPRQPAPASPPEMLAGTLTYMSPEQTGRMNRSVDSRSDLYSLGIVLHQLAAGEPPFSAADPMAWVHCHVAQVPPSLADDGTLPPALAAIVTRLLAKLPEDRYQTAAGLLHDLRHAHAQWGGTRSIEPFPLGQRDRSNRLVIPEKLYGRDSATRVLLATFNDVATDGVTRLVMVRGASGMGKSSLVRELHKAVLPSRGLFASGKIERVAPAVPYAAASQALRRLTRQLLCRPEQELHAWRSMLRAALGPNGALSLELVPELAFLIGEQAPVPAPPVPEAAARWRHVLKRLISIFAQHDHPLVLFLDDLQWLDAATLDLVDDLASDPELRHLLLVCAYRDDEFGESHPLARRIMATSRAGMQPREIAVGPLSENELARLIADATHADPDAVLPLARVVKAKTAGNPFFATRFLQELAAQGLIARDAASGDWRWDLGPILVQGHTDNVVTLMAGTLHRLPPATQRALRELSCLGSSATSERLALVHDSTEEVLHADLWDAHRAELVVRSASGYRFAHDRIQEAARSLMSDDEQAREHLRIGWLLEARHAGERVDDAIFDIVGHLHRCAALVDAPGQRERLAELELLAAQRAMATGAHEPAAAYLAAGAALLPGDAWARRHALTFELELRRAECEFLAGDMGLAKERLTVLMDRAADAVERAAVTCRLADVHFGLQQPQQSVDACLACLRHAGIDLPAQPTDTQVQAAYDALWTQLGGCAIEDLAKLPTLTDPAAQATLEVLAKMVPSAATRGRNLMALIACVATELCLRRGNCDVSCFTYVYFGGMAAARFNDFDASFRFAQLGKDLLEHPGFGRFEAVVRTYFANQILPWSRHVRSSCELNRATFDLAQQQGDRFSAAACASELVSHLLVAGVPLAEVDRAAGTGLDFARAARFPAFAAVARSQSALVCSLRGDAREGAEDVAMERHTADAPHAHTFARCFCSIHRLQACYFAGDLPGALAASAQAQALLWACPALIEIAEHAFYTALTHTAACDAAVPPERLRHLDEAAVHGRQLDAWSRRCPENWENRALLVAAEIARVEGRDLDALRLYEQAARSARDSGFVHNEALALELAARFHASRGLERIADATIAQARDAYRRWGAHGKARQLEQTHASLRGGVAPLDPHSLLQAPVEQLDVATIVQVLQAVASETDLHRLLSAILRLGLEQAGARRALLILPFGGGHRVEAEARLGPAGVEVGLQPSNIDATALPLSILHYVLRTHEDVLMQDEGPDSPFADDPYFRHRSVRSVLCLPLLKQSRLVGLIHFENDLATGAFPPARLALLKLLASEAAISLENARLYRDLQERERESRQIVDSIPGLVAALAPGGAVSAVNHQLVKFCGQPLEDIREWFTNGTIHPQDVAHVAQACTQAAEAGSAYVVDMRMRRFDGVYRWFQCRGTPLRDSASRVVRWYVLLSDIEGLKRAEADLREAERLQLEERLRERERIARALHDTLLQGAQGFILLVQAAIFRMAQADPARTMLESALTRVQDVVGESRDQIQNLRASERDDAALETRLAAIGRDLAGDTPRRFRFTRQGTPHELHPEISDEVFLIMREALINAFTHARAATVELDLGYEDAQLRLVVRDDGPGIGSEVLANGGAPGHWGLRGMHERAERMRAGLDLRRRAEHGTEIELRIAADIAYRW